MKQISHAQAERIACAGGKLEQEARFCQSEWVQENARYIADIETKRTDKTLYGEWPRGWRAEMLRASKEKAKSTLVSQFLRDECKLLDGAIWLGNWEIIQRIQK